MQKSISCLLVDDDKDDQDIFRFALKKVDPEVLCMLANDGVFALEKLQEDSAKLPEFIFVDINMPRLNGIQVLGEIKKLICSAKFPCICILLPDSRILSKNARRWVRPTSL